MKPSTATVRSKEPGSLYAVSLDAIHSTLPASTRFLDLFHVKHLQLFTRPPVLATRWLILPAVLILAVAAVGCSRPAKPQGWAGPVDSGQVLLVAHKSKLYALDSETFAPQWLFPNSAGSDVKSSSLYGTAAVDDGSVYIPTYDKKLFAVELETGELKWPSPYRTGNQIVGGALAANGMVYFGDSDGTVYAIDAETGEESWSFSTDKEVWSTPVLDGAALYVTSLDGKLYALDPSTGEELWSFETDAGIAATPVISQADNLIYVGGFDGKLRAIDLTTHEQRWSGEAGNWFWATPLVANGVVYAPSLDHKVYAFDSDSGQKHWDEPFSARAEIRTTAVLAGDTLVVVDRDGDVYGLDPQDGTKLSGPFDLGRGVNADPLALSNGQVLIVTNGGEMVRINPETLDIVSRTLLGN
jgi:outer membrane protein assembly factor BamB